MSNPKPANVSVLFLLDFSPLPDFHLDERCTRTVLDLDMELGGTLICKHCGGRQMSVNTLKIQESVTVECKGSNRESTKR